MSKNSKGFMGDQIGKLGPAVGRRWKRLMVYSAYQKHVHNPRTQKQVDNRVAFAALSVLSGDLRRALRLGLHEWANSQSSTANGEFIKLNRGAVQVANGVATVNFDELVISKGSRDLPEFGAADFSSSGRVSVPISDGNVDEENPATDRVVLVVYNPTAARMVMSDLTATRSTTSVEVRIPASWAGNTLQAYGFVVAADSDAHPYRASGSLWLGSGSAA